MTKRGRILRGTEIGPGLLTVDSKQYSFTLEGMWLSDVPPRLGMVVDATFSEPGLLTTIVAVSESQVAKEQAHKALTGALVQGVNWRDTVIGQYGWLPIGAEFLMLIAFFFLSSFTIGAMGFGHSFTGWDALAINPDTMNAHDRGVMSLLAMFFLLAPLAASFLKKAWSHWLFAAPLAFLIVAYGDIYTELQKATGAMSSFGGSGSESAYSINAGVYVSVLAALYLGTLAIRKRPHPL